MLKRFHRFMGQPIAVIIIGILMVAVTWVNIGQLAGLMMLGFVLAIGILDLIYGRTRITFSEEVNRLYKRDPGRYIRWVFWMVILLVLALNLHFTTP